MFDELDRLRETPALFALLSHYAALAAPDRQAWQDRAAIDGCEGRALTKLHGELIAYGWLELNIDAGSACYRVTPAGLRALKQVRSEAA
jgi:hypothetical protein